MVGRGVGFANVAAGICDDVRIGCELEQLVREPILKQFKDSGVSPVLIRAKDGAEAAIKSENQKFDMVLIDTEVPRLMDGGFVYGLQSYKNTQDAELLVVSTKDPSDLPESLQHCKFFKKPVSPSELINAMVAVLNAEHHGDVKPSAAAATAASGAPSGSAAPAARR